jgi:hypothetical protein
VSEPASGWAEQRARAIDAHAADLARRQAAESARAAEMLREFVAECRVPPVRLVARSYDGRHRYRTGLRGWYLRPDEGVAVADDGRYYVLAVPSSWRALVTGATLTPSAPGLVLGEGGRDGERVTLRAALDHVLAQAS